MSTISSDNESGGCHSDTTDSEYLFHVYGLLECILSFVDYNSLLRTSLVNRRWKEASRSDDLWKAAILQCWKGKAGVSINNPLFWRTLYSQQAIDKLTFSDIQSYFEHPLLYVKRIELQKCQGLAEARRILQLHMLDVVSDFPEEYSHTFFSDIYFGSFASSVKDSKRDFILKEELCSPHGFSEYFKVDDRRTANVEVLEKYGENTYLYPYTLCFYGVSRTFWMATPSRLVPQKRPVLRWKWLEKGKKLKIANFPCLRVLRRKDWGWVLENVDVVMVLRVYSLS